MGINSIRYDMNSSIATCMAIHNFVRDLLGLLPWDQQYDHCGISLNPARSTDTLCLQQFKAGEEGGWHTLNCFHPLAAASPVFLPV